MTGGACGLCGTFVDDGPCPTCGAWVSGGSTTILDQVGPQSPAPTAPPLPVFPPPPDLSRFQSASWQVRPPRRSPLVWAVPAAAAAVLALVVGIALLSRGHEQTSGTTPTGHAPASTALTAASPSRTPSSTPSPTPSPTPTALSEPQARQQLETEVARRSVVTDNHYLVELSAKWAGATDPQLIAANGTHTFMAADIWAEYQGLRTRFGDDVHMVRSTSFGKQVANPRVPAGETIYVVIYDPLTFPDKASTQTWCSRAYPGLSGDALDNVCHGRQATPAHG